MRETTIERNIRHKIEKLGGMAIKLAGTGIRGMPDRLVLLPEGTAFFIETKTIDGTVSPRQEFIGEKLYALGFQVLIFRCPEDAARYLGEVEPKTIKKRGNRKPAASMAAAYIQEAIGHD